MLDMIQMAKDLIQKGNQLGDAELVAMGVEMLQKHGEQAESLQEIPQKYVCTNCDYTFDIDKPDRKKCPKCKKNTLKIMSVATLEPHTSNRVSAGDFSTQIRQKKDSRIRYGDDGKPDGTYARTEQIEGVTNVWNDDKTEGFDKANEVLKQFTKVSPRTRRAVKFVNVKCAECGTSYDIHPLHSGRAKYTCDRCIRRRSKV